MSYEDGGNTVYSCVRCGAITTLQDLRDRQSVSKCIMCGFKVLKKVKPPVVKRVKAI